MEKEEELKAGTWFWFGLSQPVAAILCNPGYWAGHWNPRHAPDFSPWSFYKSLYSLSHHRRKVRVFPWLGRYRAPNIITVYALISFFSYTSFVHPHFLHDGGRWQEISIQILFILIILNFIHPQFSCDVRSIIASQPAGAPESFSISYRLPLKRNMDNENSYLA